MQVAAAITRAVQRKCGVGFQCCKTFTCIDALNDDDDYSDDDDIGYYVDLQVNLLIARTMSTYNNNNNIHNDNKFLSFHKWNKRTLLRATEKLIAKQKQIM